MIISKKRLLGLSVFLGLACIALLLIWANTQAAPPAAQLSSRHSGDTELLARLIRAEAGAEPYTGQVAVGAVILNRIQSPKFPHSIAGVIFQPHAFESVSNGFINQPATAPCRKAAQAAMSGWDPSGGALFFFNPSKVVGPSYVWTRRIIQHIGKHAFAL